VVRNSFQQEVNKRTVNELLSTRREQLMADVKREVLAAVRGADKPWGMDVVDVRITRVDYAGEHHRIGLPAAWKPSASAWPTSCAPPVLPKARRSAPMPTASAK
jgi:hypothetical protein